MFYENCNFGVHALKKCTKYTPRVCNSYLTIIIPIVWYWNVWLSCLNSMIVILRFLMCTTAYTGKVPGCNESFDCRRSRVLESIETFSHPSTMAGVKSEQHMTLIMQKTCQISSNHHYTFIQPHNAFIH